MATQKPTPPRDPVPTRDRPVPVRFSDWACI